MRGDEYMMNTALDVGERKKRHGAEAMPLMTNRKIKN
jgi:hypothetical protein